jgi:DNA repair exonuclease SbcCD ATPase subunit
VASLKGLSASLNTANEKAAVADARLRALRESAAGGRSSLALKDDPALAGLVQQGMQLRDQIREMERVIPRPSWRWTPRPGAACPARRDREADRGPARQRPADGQVAAQEELSQARKTVEQLQAQIAAQKAGLQKFSSRFTQAKSLEEDLAQLERASRQAMERAARLEASERSREPVFTLLESAHVPRAPSGPTT